MIITNTTSLKYEEFLAKHEDSSKANHKGSAGAIEVLGTQRIF